VFTKQSIHHYIYLGSLLLLAAMLPISKFMLSISGILLTVNWLSEWNWKKKWERLKTQPFAFVFAGFFLFSALGLFYTEHLYGYLGGFANIINKLPLFYAPIIMASSDPLSKKEQKYFFNAFIFGVLFSTLISYIFYFTHDISDIRQISILVSHIRLSLFVVFAVLLSIWLAIKEGILIRFSTSFIRRQRKILRLFYLFAAGWLLIYLFVAQTLTGIAILFLLLIYIFLYALQKKEFPFRKWVLSIFFSFISLFCVYVFWVIYEYEHIDKEILTNLERTTAQGNFYFHDVHSMVENGSPIYIYVCKEELKEAWAKRSDSIYNQSIENTLVRYLNSKHLRKDADGMKSLSEEDIQNIENKVANADYTQGFGLKKTLYPTLYSFSDYFRNGHVKYSSILQRIELWRITCKIIAENYGFGVGPGDHKSVLDNRIQEEISEMSYQSNMGCHNQFLTFWLIGGIFLVIYLIIILFFPFRLYPQSCSLLYQLFFLIVFLSLFWEDTLESQLGITFYALFNSFFLFVTKEQSLRIWKV
jgi:hypothetical protein